MKLIFCTKCQDVVKARGRELRSCSCGESIVVLLDDINAEFSGPALPLGFNNSSLAKALQNQPAEGRGERFDAFVIPTQCPTFKYIERKKDK